MCRFLFFVFFLISQVVFCQNANKNSIKITPLFSGDISIRAMAIDGDKVWYSADNGKFGSFDLQTNDHYKSRIASDSIQPEYRSIAVTNTSVFVASAGKPTLLYKIAKDSKIPRLVYTNDNEKSFCDAMKFFDDQHGLAVGDPINGCLTIWKTKNGGESWKIIDCCSVPAAVEGEAAFAASNGSLVIFKNDAWIFSGGISSRVYHSSDMGNSWSVSKTPIEQGTSMSGIFGGDFYDDNNGFAVGGNYENPNDNQRNKIITVDGGKTWKVIAGNSAFGYASCVQYFPRSRGKKLLCVGSSGIFMSEDKGESWQMIDGSTDFYTIRFIDKKSAILAGKNIMARMDFE